jgi:hypothetical protein
VTSHLTTRHPELVRIASGSGRVNALLLSPPLLNLLIVLCLVLFWSQLSRTHAYIVVLGVIFCVMLSLLIAGIISGRSVKRAWVVLDREVAEKFGARIVSVRDGIVRVRR